MSALSAAVSIYPLEVMCPRVELYHEICMLHGSDEYKVFKLGSKATFDDANHKLKSLKIKALKKVDMDKWGRQIAILNEVLVSLYEEDPLDLLTITRKTDQLHEAQSELRLLLQIHPQPNADDARHHLM